MDLAGESVSYSGQDGAAAILDELPVAVLKLCEDARVTYFNKCAKAVFDPVQPGGLAVLDLLGQVGVRNGAHLADAIKCRVAVPTLSLGFADGRFFEGRCAPLADGGQVITLMEITEYLRGPSAANRLHLPERAELLEHLGQCLPTAPKKGNLLALLSINLTDFGKDNEALGRSLGDALKRKVAQRIRNSVRKIDLVASLGDDEFAILQAHLPLPAPAQELALRVIDLIGRSYVIDGRVVNITASVGVAVSPDDGDDPQTLLINADFALLRAKASGSGTYCLYDPTMAVDLRERRAIEDDLRKALILNQFELFYQPQYELTPRKLKGFEALLRWRHPTRGMVSPAAFVPLAEDLGLITEIGEWVLRTACLAAASWSKPVSVAVNVSPLQFRGPRLIPAVRAALDASGLPPERLDIEITEGSLLENSDDVMRALEALKALGVRISMDDFGTGYSSLGYLQKFPFDKIKIDQSFVRGQDAEPQAGGIVSAIAALGSSMGMNTVAEGVETAEQMERVLASGCNVVQGYLTGRPMVAAEASALVASLSADDV
jgi:diguanylate cyclase (GGDEF)-like protein